MIEVTFFQDDKGALKGYSFSGHSDYAEAGYDIVCSAVSSAAYMAANTITEILGLEIDAEVADGSMKVEVLNPDDAADSILKGLKLHLKTLSGQYPDDITFREV